MSKFEEYSSKYKNLKMERQDGILLVTLHRNNGPVIWVRIASRNDPRSG
jgi:hypothetical protein